MLLKAVFLEDGGPSEGLLAHLALIRLDPVYSEPVSLQRVVTGETFQTMPALIRLFAAVDDRVRLEVRALNEGQSALFTFVRPFIVVRADVSVQVCGPREGLLAELASEGLQPGVDAGVLFQVRHVEELRRAGGTLVRFDLGVVQLVTDKTALAAEHCGAHRAF